MLLYRLPLSLLCMVLTRRYYVYAISEQQQPSLTEQPMLDSASVRVAIQEALTDLCHCMSEHHKKCRTSHRDRSSTNCRPFVTLTYAQTLDGKIAVKENSGASPSSSNFSISSPESVILTHALRSMHDAILIGGRTLAIDNPRLTNRLWKADGETTISRRQPRPVVLDPTLRHIRSILDNKQEKLRTTEHLIVCCTHDVAASFNQQQHHQLQDFDTLSSASSTCNNNKLFTLLPCKVDHGHGNRLNLQDVLNQLYQHYGIQSVMVEGGSAILTAFVRARPVVDYQIVTISPKLMGDLGVPSLGQIACDDDLAAAANDEADTDVDTPSSFRCITIGPFRSLCLGPDCILFSRWIQHTI